MIYLFAIHILSLLFAYFNGRHDVPAVNSFAHSGSSEEQQEMFHSSNWKLKLVVCLLTFLPLTLLPFSYRLFYGCFLGFLVSGLNIWMTFDIWVNKYRYIDVPWWYLSTGNKVDRNLVKTFGQYAGVWKLLICAALSIVITIIYLLYLQ